MSRRNVECADRYIEELGLPGGTMIYFECPPRIMNYGRPVAMAVDPIKPDHVVWYTIPTESDLPAPERISVEDVPLKLWHDDIRRPPSDDWVWARTNREAIAILETGNVVEASLDHDLGLHGRDPDADGAYYLKGSGEETGLDLVEWMTFTDHVPPKVTIHSWNPVGAQEMQRRFWAQRHRVSNDFTVVLQPAPPR